MKLGLDKRLPLAGDVRLALTLGQKAGSGKADLGTATAVPVVDRRDVPADNLNAVERHIIARLCGLDGLLLLRSWAGLLRAQDKRETKPAKLKAAVFQRSSFDSNFKLQLRSRTVDYGTLIGLQSVPISLKDATN